MQNVLAYIRAHRTRFENELIEYLRIPSVSAQSSHQPDMQACAAWIASHARQIGLRADVISTPGHPVVLARTFTRRTPGRPHFVVYGHYDVQPPEPLDLWHSPPFEPRRAGRRLYARGASDNKGQHFAHLKAVEACLHSGAGLPVDLTFLIEGEEEVGSRSLPAFLRQRRRELRCEAFVISDTGIPDLQHPALTYALRGIAAVEVALTGPSRDLHSGIHGGAVDNPALALCQLLAQLRDPRGRITVPGFYRDVRTLTAYERRELDRIPHSDAAYRRFLGTPRLFGEHGFTTSERRTARPTLEINGLTSGYQGQGSKTIIPSWARAKLTLRLVPDQRPSHVIRSLISHIRRLCPPTVRLEIKSGHGGEPYCMSPRHPLAQAALRALQTAFNRPPVLMREGGSIPIVNDFKRILGADSLLLGLALPDADAHAPNENFHLDCFERGIALGACLWPELARACSKT